MLPPLYTLCLHQEFKHALGQRGQEGSQQCRTMRCWRPPAEPSAPAFAVITRMPPGSWLNRPTRHVAKFAQLPRVLMGEPQAMNTGHTARSRPRMLC